MIKSSLNSPDPGDPITSVLDALIDARRQLEQLLGTVDPLLEDLQDSSIEDVRPRLGELMQQLLGGTRTIVEIAEGLPGDIGREVEAAQRVLSERLLEFRRAMGSGSTDTIQQSLRSDLAVSAGNWIGLVGIIIDHIKTMREDA